VRDGIPVMLESEARRVEPDFGDTAPGVAPGPAEP